MKDAEKISEVERACLLMMRDLGATIETATKIMGTLNCEKEDLEVKQFRFMRMLKRFSETETRDITEQDLLNMIGYIIQ